MPEEPQIATVTFAGVKSKIFVDDREDYVHREILAGQYYELHQLIRHKSMIPYAPGRVVIDVGANIGNHSIFYARHTRAEKVIALEMNPRAAALLEQSIEINNLSGRVITKHLRTAVSDRVGYVEIGHDPQKNLGATKIKSHQDTGRELGSNRRVLPCDTLDNLLIGQRPSFLKIDVEGHEMSVLEGANNLIDQYRPAIAIEVNWSSEPKFWKWMKEKAYHCVDYFHDYESVKNYCIIPMSIAGV